MTMSPGEAEPSREAKVVETLLELADTLVDDFDIIESLTILARRCVEILDTAATGILLADDDGYLQLVAASSEQARLLELFQLQNDEGPCMEAFASGTPVFHTELSATTERWPRFTPFALGAGYASVYAMPLRLRGNTIGALNLFRSEPGPLDPHDIILAQSLADLASITILQAAAAPESLRREEQLRHALDSRIVIEQAKGMLADHCQLDMAAAFDRIRSRSRNTNMKLTEVAANIVSGDIKLTELTASDAGDD